MKTNTVGLTKRQKETLEFIIKFKEKTGYMPTIREIGKGMGVSSPTTPYTHFTYLVAKGYIIKGDKSRTYKINEKAKIDMQKRIDNETAEYWFRKYNKLQRDIKDYVYNKEIETEHFNSKDLIDTSIGGEILEIIERD